MRLGLMLILPLLFASCSADKQPAVRPNILLILTDDQGWGDAGFHGNDSIDTPNLDWLASHSVEFTQFYVSPVCAPTRASLLTGRYHLATGTSWVTHRQEVMRSSEYTLAEMLKEQGYRTGLFGKWHNGKQYPHDPNGQGFDTFVGFADGHLNNYFDSPIHYNQERRISKGYMPDIITEEAIAFMQETGPFFAYLSFNTPHSPFQVPDQYFEKYKNKGFDDRTASIYGMVENIDDNLGMVLNALKQSGKEEETVVIFLTDNGPNGYRYNGGYKGIKSHVDEGGVRVPFLIRYPGKQWDDGSKRHALAAHIDVLPTLADLLGLALPKDRAIHGRSLLADLENNTKPEPRLYYTHQVIRQFDTIPGAVRNGQYLLTLKPGETAFYDLETDPYQKEDIKARHPELVAEFQAAYQQWFTLMNESGLEPEPIEVGHEQAPFIEFPAPDLSEKINLQFAGGEGWANDWLIGWNNQSQAVWQLRCVAASNYEVLVELSNDPGSGELAVLLGGEKLTKSIATENIKTPIASPDRVPRGEMYAYEWPLIHLGNIELKEGLQTLVVTSQNIKNLEIKSIQLKRTDHDRSDTEP